MNFLHIAIKEIPLTYRKKRKKSFCGILMTNECVKYKGAHLKNRKRDEDPKYRR